MPLLTKLKNFNCILSYKYVAPSGAIAAYVELTLNNVAPDGAKNMLKSSHRTVNTNHEISTPEQFSTLDPPCYFRALLNAFEGALIRTARALR